MHKFFINCTIHVISMEWFNIFVAVKSFSPPCWILFPTQVNYFPSDKDEKFTNRQSRKEIDEAFFTKLCLRYFEREKEKRRMKTPNIYFVRLMILYVLFMFPILSQQHCRLCSSSQKSLFNVRKKRSFRKVGIINLTLCY